MPLGRQISPSALDTRLFRGNSTTGTGVTRKRRIRNKKPARFALPGFSLSGSRTAPRSNGRRGMTGTIGLTFRRCFAQRRGSPADWTASGRNGAATGTSGRLWRRRVVRPIDRWALEESQESLALVEAASAPSVRMLLIEPGIDGGTDLVQLACEKMVHAFDDDQALRLRQRRDQFFEIRARAE